MSIYVQHKSPNAKPEVVTGSNPAAGAEVSETVPDGEVWELLSVTFTLVTDATSATRRATLALGDGTTRVGRFLASNVQTASLTGVYTFGAGSGMPGVISGESIYQGSFPRGIALLPGWKIETVTSSLQAGDNYGAPILCVVKAKA